MDAAFYLFDLLHILGITEKDPEKALRGDDCPAGKRFSKRDTIHSRRRVYPRP